MTKQEPATTPENDDLVAHRGRMREAMWVLDGTTTSRVALLAGVTPEDIDRLGGIDE